MTREQMRRRLAEILQVESIKKGDFVLASGRRSNYYLDCRRTTLHPEGAYLVGKLVLDAADRRGWGAEAVGGLTLGADPIANALAVISYQKGKPIKSFIVRKDVKAHGTRSALEGNVHAGERVVIIDDVITTGGSTITAIERAREAGLTIDRVIALIDREEGGRENILAHTGRVDAVLTRTEIMSRYRHS